MRVGRLATDAGRRWTNTALRPIRRLAKGNAIIAGTWISPAFAPEVKRTKAAGNVLRMGRNVADHGTRVKTEEKLNMLRAVSWS